MRARDPELGSRWGTICTPTRMMASDGKCYSTQAANMEGIFRIIQSIPVASRRLTSGEVTINRPRGLARAQRLAFCLNSVLSVDQ